MGRGAVKVAHCVGSSGRIRWRPDGVRIVPVVAQNWDKLGQPKLLIRKAVPVVPVVPVRKGESVSDVWLEIGTGGGRRAAGNSSARPIYAMNIHIDLGPPHKVSCAGVHGRAKCVVRSCTYRSIELILSASFVVFCIKMRGA